MLRICPICHRMFYEYESSCPECEWWKNRPKTNEKTFINKHWLLGSFEDLNICTEGLSSCQGVYEIDKEKEFLSVSQDSRFSKEGKEAQFKLSLKTNQSPQLLIAEDFCYDRTRNRDYYIRKPFIGVVFEEDSEERYICLDAFRKRRMFTRTQNHEITTVLTPSVFNSNDTYESIYLSLNKVKYKKFLYACGQKLKIDDLIISNHGGFCEYVGYLQLI